MSEQHTALLHCTVSPCYGFSIKADWLGNAPRGSLDSHAADQASILKTHLKFPSKMCELEKLNCINSFSNVPRISKARMLLSVPVRCSVLTCANFPGELETSLSSGALTNRLLELCAGKMGLFSAERMVNLHLNEYFFLEGIFHCRSNKFFSWVSCSQPSHLWDAHSRSLITKVLAGKPWPGQRVLLKGKE